MECRHHSAEEHMDDKAFRKLSRWTPSSHQRLVVVDEARQAKVFRLRGDMEPVAVGLPVHERFEGVKVDLRKSVMPSQEGRGVRSSAFKVERAAMYNVRHASGSGPRRGVRTSQVINYEELERALASFGGRA